MKIRSVVAGCADLQLTRPYTIAYKTVTHVENVVVKIELDNGITGTGTANPSKYVVGSDTAGTLRALKPELLDELQGKDIRAFYSLLQFVQTSFPREAGARAALDIALHDAFTQWLGVPLVAFLGQRVKRLPTSITIGIKNVAETLVEAQEYVERGFRILKIKLGQSPEEDIERLVKLRETFGNSIVLRIDANQGYTASELVNFYERTVPLHLELIEQPLKADAVEAMKALPAELRQLIAADESLVNAADAFRLAGAPAACGIFNIKLMKCGGIQPAREIASIAQHAGIDLMWGCNDESVVSISAALHTALSCAATRYLDLDGSFDLARDIVSGGFTVKDGYMSLTGQPGLGVSLLS